VKTIKRVSFLSLPTKRYFTRTRRKKNNQDLVWSAGQKGMKLQDIVIVSDGAGEVCSTHVMTPASSVSRKRCGCTSLWRKPKSVLGDDFILQQFSMTVLEVCEQNLPCSEK